MLRWRTVSGDARPFVEPPAFQPLEPFRGRPVPVVSKSEFAGTASPRPTSATSRWSVGPGVEPGGRGAHACSRAGEPFVYAYYDGVDKIAHVRGFGEYYDAELIALDRMVGDLLDVSARRGRPGRDRRPRTGGGGVPGDRARPSGSWRRSPW